MEPIGPVGPYWPLGAAQLCKSAVQNNCAERPLQRAYHVIGVPTSQYGLRTSARLGWGSFSTKATQGIKCDICLSDMFHTLAARVPGASGNFKSINEYTLAEASGQKQNTLAEASGQKQNTLAKASGIVSV